MNATLSQNVIVISYNEVPPTNITEQVQLKSKLSSVPKGPPVSFGPASGTSAPLFTPEQIAQATDPRSSSSLLLLTKESNVGGDLSLQMERQQCGPFPLWTTGLVMQCDFTYKVQEFCLWLRSRFVRFILVQWPWYVHECCLKCFPLLLATGQKSFDLWHSKHFPPPMHRICCAQLQPHCIHVDVVEDWALNDYCTLRASPSRSELPPIDPKASLGFLRVHVMPFEGCWPNRWGHHVSFTKLHIDSELDCMRYPGLHVGYRDFHSSQRRHVLFDTCSKAKQAKLSNKLEAGGGWRKLAG